MKPEYKDYILDAYHAELKRTRHIIYDFDAPDPMAYLGARRYEQNAKRKKSYKLKLAKLRKFVSRAWAGYSYGKIKAKATT